MQLYLVPANHVFDCYFVAAQFTFNRDGRGNQSFADYLTKEDEYEIPEEPHDELEDSHGSFGDNLSSSFEKPQLSDVDHGMHKSTNK